MACLCCISAGQAEIGADLHPSENVFVLDKRWDGGGTLPAITDENVDTGQEEAVPHEETLGIFALPTGPAPVPRLGSKSSEERSNGSTRRVGSSSKSVGFGTTQALVILTEVREGDAGYEGEVKDRHGTPDFYRKRSGTSRGLDQSMQSDRSIIIPEVGLHIDPNHGLRRLDSVNTVKGDVHEKYKTVNKLGEGSFGQVMEVVSVANGEHYALKIIPVTNLKDSKRFEQELGVTRRLKHPHIIRLHETFREGDSYHLVMEKSDGGDLFDRIIAGPSHLGRPGLRAKQIAKYAWQMLAGVAYLHHYQFVHRDIKPENYLLESRKENAGLKLIDFGLARSCPRGERMTSRVGTPHYVAPEVVSDKSTGYTAKCDVWSVGVTVWFIAVGNLPFTGKDQNEVLKNVVRGAYEFKPNIWEPHEHPQQLMALIMELMTKDVEQRPWAKAVVSGNQWLKEYGDPLRATDDSCCTIL